MSAKLKIITSMIIFGSIGIFVKNINLSSLELAFFRATIGSLFLICAIFLKKQSIALKSIKENLFLLIASGTALGLNWIFLFQAYKYTTIPNATLSYYFAPVFVMMLSPIILKEKLTKVKTLSILLALTGLFLILNINGTSNIGSYSDLKGIIYGLLGASVYASVILMNKFIKNLSGFETTLVQLMMAGIVLLISVLYKNNLNIIDISHKSWIFIFIVGIVHTGIAYLLYFTSVKELSGQSIAILSYIDPIFAVVISAILLRETMSLIQVIGGILILGSTFLSERLETYLQGLSKIDKLD